jgi:hypothetical protein
VERRELDAADLAFAAAPALPGGPLLLLVAGAVLIGTGLWQLVKAAKADFLRHLAGRVASQTWVMWLGRAGYAARGIVFVIIGWSLLQAGLSDSAAPAGGMEQALASLSGTLLTLAALGLLLFGLFSFVEARYRRINDRKVAARLKGAMTA